MRSSRRSFMQGIAAGGIAFSLSRVSSAAEPTFDAYETLPGRQGWNPAARGAGRIDGVAKVTGAKLYASDFRASDMPGWPGETRHALLVRAPDATHVFEGIDLEKLPTAARPDAIVTAEDVARSGFVVPDFYAGDLFCPEGSTPLYLGQPLALLIFDRFDAFDEARLLFREQQLIRFGAETGPLQGANYGAFRFTRIAGPTPDAPDVYSPIQEGWVSPGKFEAGGRPIWAPLPISTGRPYAAAARYGEGIRAGLTGDDPDLLVLDRGFETQSVDPMFLEPEGGLAWFDAGKGDLKLVVGVQSPYELATSLGILLGSAEPPLRPAHVDLNFAYLGGGFGGRDHTPFPLYLALAGCSRPIVRCALRMTATSSSRLA